MTKPATPKNLPSLRAAAIEIDGTVTRPLRFTGGVGEALLAATREAMLKRGCLRDRAHKGQCLNCALLPRCAVWPLIAPSDPTRRQRGVFVRPWVPRLPDLPSIVPVGERVTFGLTVVQDGTFPALWGAFAAAFVGAARQLEEWGFGDLVTTPGGPARRGVLSVGRVRWLNPVTGETQPFVYTEDAPMPPPFWFEGQQPAARSPQPAGGADDDMGHLRVAFLTPTRLVAGDAVLRSPECGTLVRRITERLEAVCAGSQVAPPADLDAVAAVAAAGRLQIAADETRWEGGDKRGGLRGTVAYTGAAYDLAAVLPALRWGQVLGVGKGAQNGAGRMEVAGSR